jgi:hypothetical protein
MKIVSKIDGTQFTFPSGWRVSKYDETSFHQRQFQGFAGGSKAVDAVAVSPELTVWLIEVKDYRHFRRDKPGSVFSEMAAKVRATLAGLATARIRANVDEERHFADHAMHGRAIRVALHLDQPVKNSRLFPQIVDPKSAIDLLRREMRAIDPHAICYGCGIAAHNLPWTVDQIKD